VSPEEAIKATHRLRELMNEASSLASQLRDSGPVDGRFEASNLVAAIADADECRRDLSLTYRELT
jgi:hypothetical protein